MKTAIWGGEGPLKQDAPTSSPAYLATPGRTISDMTGSNRSKAPHTHVFQFA